MGSKESIVSVLGQKLCAGCRINTVAGDHCLCELIPSAKAKVATGGKGTGAAHSLYSGLRHCCRLVDWTFLYTTTTEYPCIELFPAWLPGTWEEGRKKEKINDVVTCEALPQRARPPVLVKSPPGSATVEEEEGKGRKMIMMMKSAKTPTFAQFRHTEESCFHV